MLAIPPAGPIRIMFISKDLRGVASTLGHPTPAGPIRIMIRIMLLCLVPKKNHLVREKTFGPEKEPSAKLGRKKN